MSNLLITLTLYLLLPMLLSKSPILPGNESLLIILRSLFLTISFSTLRAIQFFIAFEISLVPVTIIVLTYGQQPERVGGGIFIILYTSIGSLPLLIFIINFDI